MGRKASSNDAEASIERGRHDERVDKGLGGGKGDTMDGDGNVPGAKTNAGGHRDVKRGSREAAGAGIDEAGCRDSVGGNTGTVGGTMRAAGSFCAIWAWRDIAGPLRNLVGPADGI